MFAPAVLEDVDEITVGTCVFDDINVPIHGMTFAMHGLVEGPMCGKLSTPHLLTLLGRIERDAIVTDLVAITPLRIYAYLCIVCR
jgi:hypothetical protein